MQWLTNLFGMNDEAQPGGYATNGRGKDPVERLTEALDEVCLGEFNTRADAYNAAEDPEEILKLKHPKQFERMARRAASETARLIITYVQDHNRQLDFRFPELAGHPALQDFRLSAADQSRLEDHLALPLQPFYAEWQSYSERYQRFVRRLGKAGEGTWHRAMENGHTGAAIGRTFGPLGEIAGAFLGGYLAGNEAQEKLEGAYDRLDRAFLVMVRACGAGLEGVRDAALTVIQGYHHGVADCLNQNAPAPDSVPLIGRQP